MKETAGTVPSSIYADKNIEEVDALTKALGVYASNSILDLTQIRWVSS